MRCSWKDQCRDSVLTFVFTFLAEIHEKCIHSQISRKDRRFESARAHPRVRSRSLFRLVVLAVDVLTWIGFRRATPLHACARFSRRAFEPRPSRIANRGTWSRVGELASGKALYFFVRFCSSRRRRRKHRCSIVMRIFWI